MKYEELRVQCLVAFAHADVLLGRERNEEVLAAYKKAAQTFAYRNAEDHEIADAERLVAEQDEIAKKVVSDES